MKKIIFGFLFLSILACIISSCEKDFLETKPTNAVDASSAYTSTANMFALLNGIHRSLYAGYSRQSQNGQGTINIFSDMLGEDVVMTAAGNGWFNNAYKWIEHRTKTSEDLLYCYWFYYKVIGNANWIISKTPGVTGELEDKKILMGQAYAYRAWAHFMLVQLFGKRYDATAVPNDQLGVPIMISNTQIGQPRSTVEEVYAQVNKDLDSAMVNLTGYSRPNKSHINLNVVQGIKARVALTQQNWAVAATYAALARTGFTLMDNAKYLSGFNDYTNSEWIWGATVISDQTTDFNSFFAYMSYNFSSTNIRGNPKAINKLLYNQIPATDIRRNLWIVAPTATNPNIPSAFTRKPYMNVKFKAAGEADSRGDHCWMRAAEMYFIEAEALSRQGGQDAAAAALLFAVVSPRNPSYVLSTSTGATLLNQILLYRRIELWGEGFRFLDLKRMNLGVDRSGSNHSLSLSNQIFLHPAGTDEWQFFIPEDEMNANPALAGQQNP